MADRTRRVKNFGDIEKTYQAASWLVGKTIYTIPWKPYVFDEHKWFHSIHLVQQNKTIFYYLNFISKKTKNISGRDYEF